MAKHDFFNTILIAEPRDASPTKAPLPCPPSPPTSVRADSTPPTTQAAGSRSRGRPTAHRQRSPSLVADPDTRTDSGRRTKPTRGTDDHVDEDSGPGDASNETGSDDDDDDDEDPACIVCASPKVGRKNVIVFCDGQSCDIPVHQKCYDVPTIPPDDEQWFCQRCQDGVTVADTQVACCPVRTGAFKRTDRPGVYVHVVCGLWHADVDTENPERWIVANASAPVTPCALCGKAEGLTVTCGVVDDDDGSGDDNDQSGIECPTAYHVSCAVDAGLLTVPSPPAGADPPLLCAQHKNLRRTPRRGRGRARRSTLNRETPPRKRKLVRKASPPAARETPPRKRGRPIIHDDEEEEEEEEVLMATKNDQEEGEGVAGLSVDRIKVTEATKMPKSEVTGEDAVAHSSNHLAPAEPLSPTLPAEPVPSATDSGRSSGSSTDISEPNVPVCSPPATQPLALPLPPTQALPRPAPRPAPKLVRRPISTGMSTLRSDAEASAPTTTLLSGTGGPVPLAHKSAPSAAAAARKPSFLRTSVPIHANTNTVVATAPAARTTPLPRRNSQGRADASPPDIGKLASAPSPARPRPTPAESTVSAPPARPRPIPAEPIVSAPPASPAITSAESTAADTPPGRPSPVTDLRRSVLQTAAAGTRSKPTPPEPTPSPTSRSRSRSRSPGRRRPERDPPTSAGRTIDRYVSSPDVPPRHDRDMDTDGDMDRYWSRSRDGRDRERGRDRDRDRDGGGDSGGNGQFRRQGSSGPSSYRERERDRDREPESAGPRNPPSNTAPRTRKPVSSAAFLPSTNGHEVGLGPNPSSTVTPPVLALDERLLALTQCLTDLRDRVVACDGLVRRQTEAAAPSLPTVNRYADLQRENEQLRLELIHWKGEATAAYRSYNETTDRLRALRRDVTALLEPLGLATLPDDGGQKTLPVPTSGTDPDTYVSRLAALVQHLASTDSGATQRRTDVAKMVEGWVHRQGSPDEKIPLSPR
ncbi:hypothetical protein IWQ60_002397 [Tieghemiomyces parasiticus]|uniref:PHD-type domain-containing protein n=1 Tax=Tieghemiomyces parasiticus TaxID=78921 RepID=A0A9W8AJL1_9FUNG|nr:hypothetical protein IWQ60_002397 [Tieghemiomyces parasiticus]